MEENRALSGGCNSAEVRDYGIVVVLYLTLRWCRHGAGVDIELDIVVNTNDDVGLSRIGTAIYQTRHHIREDSGVTIYQTSTMFNKNRRQWRKTSRRWFVFHFFYPGSSCWINKWMHWRQRKSLSFATGCAPSIKEMKIVRIFIGLFARGLGCSTVCSVNSTLNGWWWAISVFEVPMLTAASVN